MKKLLKATVTYTSVLRPDGTIWEWGTYCPGLLNAGITSKPTRILKLNDVVCADSGLDHSAALKKDWAVWTWGSNEYGQLGDGSLEHRPLPTQITTISEVIDIACGGNFTLAVQENGAVWAWGYNLSGTMGNGVAGEDHNNIIPAKIRSLQHVVAVAAGDDHCLALKDDLTVWAWGDNSRNQLGSGEPFPEIPKNVLFGPEDTRAFLELGKQWTVSTPELIPSLPKVTNIAAGVDCGYAVENGRIWAWGDNDKGQLGSNSIGKTIIEPVRIDGIKSVVSIAGGEDHTLAITDDGTVWAWGGNEYGQLGFETTQRSTSKPTQVPLLEKIIAIAAGSHYSIAMNRDGVVWSWGRNKYGQLGDGTTQNRHIPTQVVWPD